MAIKKICIIGLEDYAMLTGDASYGYIGGESVQHVLLARAWRDLGLDVSIIVRDHGQPRVTTVDGIRAVAAYRQHAGIRGLRFMHPRLTGVMRAMREIDADVYYQSPAAHWSGVAVGFAKHLRRRSILRIASDSDCVPGRQPLRYSRDRWLFGYGVRNASLIAAQTEQQRQLLARHYGVRSEILNIAVEPPRATSARSKDVDVLWVGNLRPVKRPDIALELARRLPQYRFALVGGSVPRAAAYFERIASQAQGAPNVVMTGGVSYQDVGDWFDRSRVHLNTSDYEGFPNTFLQAWIRGVPVASFFDPDRLIERRGLGRRCEDVDGMCAAIDELLRDPAGCGAIGARAQAFVSNQYSARQVALKYLELLDQKKESPLRPRVEDQSITAVRDL
ncbi:MAG: glycosyltransferase family 4 protein [Steroidobacter sp.]